MLPTFTRRAACAAIAALAASGALAWTDKPVRMIVPAPPGGTMDVVARVLADQLSADIGQPVLVENKPGAGGGIGVQALLAAPLDGRTIMLTSSNVLTEIPHVMKTGFDPIQDVRPVAVIARSGMVLVGAPGLPAHDFKSLVTYLKANPGKTTFATYSAGTSSHYAGLILNAKAGLDMQHVPFAGSPPALSQLMANQVTIMFDGIVTSKPFITSGKIQAYGVASKTRSPHLPNVPTLAEQGFPDLDVTNWFGVIVPSKLPVAMADKIHDAIAKAAANPKVRERFVGAGLEIADDVPPSALPAMVREEFDHNLAIVKAYNIKLN